MDSRTRTGGVWAGRLAPLALAMASLGAHAQVFEEVELRREGNDAIVQVRFNVPVQFRRAVASASNDLVQVVYDVVPSRDKPRFIDGERRTIGGDGIPRITISEDGGNGESDRRLVVRLDPPARFRVRGGSDRRSIEIVLEGLGPQAFGGGAPKPAAQPPAAVAPVAVAAPASLDAQVEARGAELMTQARAAIAKGQNALAVETLNETLNLPPNSHTREAQALIAQARLADGDTDGARRELTLFLQLYPAGPDADQARVTLAGLPGAAAPGTPGQPGTAEAAPRKKDTTTLVGAWSQYYYGGNSKTQTQLKDTPLDGQIPEVISDQTLTGVDQKQLLSSLDVNWRMKDESRDLRFVFRDSFTANGMPDQADENKLSALYLDWKETGPGLSLRLGRQSGLGGGVLGRFDGGLLGWTFVPKWKLNLVGGQPTDKLLDTRRRFFGLSLDAEALAPGFGASTYAIQQNIDGEIDRRAVGADLRYFQPGVSAFSQFEYDTTLKGINIASVQGTWTSEDNTVVNVLYDRRATPMLMLGNALFFPADPNALVLPRKLTDLLALGKTLDMLRQQVKDTTAYATQGLLGVTTPLDPHWQAGADLRLTNVGAIAPVPGVLPDGIPATGDIWSAGLQLIGSNLFSERDTHVFNLTAVKGPAYDGWLASYNLLSVWAERWQVEPSLRLYQQDGPNGVKTSRWAPGLRVTWRDGEKWVLESDLNVESSRTRSAQQNENATRLYYSLGYRLDF